MATLPRQGVAGARASASRPGANRAQIMIDASRSRRRFPLLAAALAASLGACSSLPRTAYTAGGNGTRRS